MFIKPAFNLVFIILIQNVLMGQTHNSEPSKNKSFYFIDPSGSDTTGDGSELKPWASLSFACFKVIVPESTIHINPGKYYVNKTCILASGVNIEGEGDTSHIISHVKGGAGVISLISSTKGANDGNQKISFIRLDGELSANRGFILTIEIM